MQPSFRRPRKKLVSDINVVPYIDVMLVLLIVFMITAPLVTQGVKVNLPQAAAQALAENSTPPIIATIDRQGLYYLSIDETSKQVLNSEQITALVKAQLAKNPTAQFIVKGDGHVPYQHVINLMVILQNAGVPSIGLMTDPDNNEK
ncbi:MAG: protein TolR [Psychromonas sp.]|nr:protein TolR [Psychromonas sp.]